MKKIILISIASVISINSIKLNTSWRVGPDEDLDLDEGTRLSFGKYLMKYHRNFKSQEEFKMRAKLYKEHHEEIERFNREEAEEAGFTMEDNQFTDLTDEEFEHY